MSMITIKRKNVKKNFFDNFTQSTFLIILLNQLNLIPAGGKSIFANLHFFADSRSRAQELSNDVSFFIFGHKTWDLEGAQHILVFKYPSRDGKLIYNRSSE